MARRVPPHDGDSRAYLVAENEAACAMIEASFSKSGIDGIAVVDGGHFNSMSSLARSLAVARDLPVVMVVEARDEEDRYFKAWLSLELEMGHGLRVLPAAPGLSEALGDPAWTTRLEALIGAVNRRKRR